MTNASYSPTVGRTDTAGAEYTDICSPVGKAKRSPMDAAKKFGDDMGWRDNDPYYALCGVIEAYAKEAVGDDPPC